MPARRWPATSCRARWCSSTRSNEPRPASRTTSGPRRRQQPRPATRDRARPGRAGGPPGDPGPDRALSARRGRPGLGRARRPLHAGCADRLHGLRRARRRPRIDESVPPRDSRRLPPHAAHDGTACGDAGRRSGDRPHVLQQPDAHRRPRRLDVGVVNRTLVRRRVRAHAGRLAVHRPPAGTLQPRHRPQGRAGMSFVRVEQPRAGVALVTLDRPDRRNAMAFDVMIPLREAREAVSRDNDVRVVVLTGAGDAFCSGADLEDPGRVPDVEGLTLSTIALRSMELLDDVILAIRRMHQPVIAAVNGPAIGGGFCLALACDIRLAAPTAYFRAAGIANGLTASELGISYLLPRVAGAARAAEIMLTGRDVDAEEAGRIGIVADVVEADGLLDEAYTMAERIRSFSRPGVE